MDSKIRKLSKKSSQKPIKNVKRVSTDKNGNEIITYISKLEADKHNTERHVRTDRGNTFKKPSKKPSKKPKEAEKYNKKKRA